MKIQLPTTINEDAWFYKDNEELCRPHLGKPYISYSTISSWEDLKYRDELIVEKFSRIKPRPKDMDIYKEFGSYLGEAVEKSVFGDNPRGFTGQENLELVPRPEGAKYEEMVLIDFGDFVLIGFIDIMEERDKVADITDLKTGGNKKEGTYTDRDYVQVVLYGVGLEERGYSIGKTGVWFVRREGSHVNPPLKISDEQFYIPLEYSEERKKYAMDKTRRVVDEISECYGTYLKFFGE